jgi:hypothetical protein
MFQLLAEELENWRSHFVTSKSNAKMGLRRPPYAFTELGVAMLSSVLNSKRAVQMNINYHHACLCPLARTAGQPQSPEEKIEKLEHPRGVLLNGFRPTRTNQRPSGETFRRCA